MYLHDYVMGTLWPEILLLSLGSLALEKASHHVIRSPQDKELRFPTENRYYLYSSFLFLQRGMYLYFYIIFVCVTYFYVVFTFLRGNEYLDELPFIILHPISV